LTERGSIGDEAIFLRIQMLQKGLLQFTDSTNAYKLVREFGKGIRFIALCIPDLNAAVDACQTTFSEANTLISHCHFLLLSIAVLNGSKIGKPLFKQGFSY